MPPTKTPRDHSRRHQAVGPGPPAAKRGATVAAEARPPAPSRPHIPPPPSVRSPSSSTTQNQLYHPRTQDILPQYPPGYNPRARLPSLQPGENPISLAYCQPQRNPNALPPLAGLFGPLPREPPPHVLPLSPPPVPLLPQHPPASTLNLRPPSPDPEDRLRQLALAALGPEVFAWRRIKKATVPAIGALGLPHMPPRAPPLLPVVLPSVREMTEGPPSSMAETMKRIQDMGSDDNGQSTNTGRHRPAQVGPVPNARPLSEVRTGPLADTQTTSSVRAGPPVNAQSPPRIATRRSSTAESTSTARANHGLNARSPSAVVTSSSSTTTHASNAPLGSQSASRTSPSSTSSSQCTTKKRHRFGDVSASSQHII